MAKQPSIEQDGVITEALSTVFDFGFSCMAFD